MQENQLRKLAGLPLNESADAGLKTDQIPNITKALISAGAFKLDGLEWVYDDDDGETVKGPDGKEGWFNNSNFAHAVDKFDPATVRAVVEFFWMIGRMQKNDLDERDLVAITKMIPLV